ncbi:hypothetical protein Patl1_19396 [Pistacia atlantica]|uniref:Uncharacterized protein n=1 Tax=Pistacia atlantica TaxID=434234 RepID=A0ACC1BXW4_9ROSI|nr:hypothetical protein Patl1_19396 [Pistacia atlantica]
MVMEIARPLFRVARATTKASKPGRLPHSVSFQTCKTLVTVIGMGFIAKSMGFVNTTGFDGHQAMALRVASDYSTIFHYKIDGYQTSFSTLIVRKSNNNDENYTVTAQVRRIRQQTATMVIHNCTIVPDEKLFLDKLKAQVYLALRKILFKTYVYDMSMGIAALVPKEVRGKRVKWSGAKGISKDQA